MFGRLKKALVESYVGAIALGWMFAQSVFHLIGAITDPLTTWERQRILFSELRIGEARQPRITIQSSIPDLIAALALALVCLLLLRWLYYSPIEEESTLAGTKLIIDQ
jgi:hypothetical protein